MDTANPTRAKVRCAACEGLVDAEVAVWAYPGKPAGPNDLAPFHPECSPERP